MANNSLLMQRGQARIKEVFKDFKKIKKLNIKNEIKNNYPWDVFIDCPKCENPAYVIPNNEIISECHAFIKAKGINEFIVYYCGKCLVSNYIPLQ